MNKIPMIVDETGQPYIILKDQQQQQRATGIDALKNNIFATVALGNVLKSSYGPRGMDKALISKDGEVSISNDGRTILESIDLSNQICKLIVELSIGHDDEIGDGTTGVALLACSLCSQAIPLLDKGLHPLRIAEGYEFAAQKAVEYLDTIAEVFDFTKDNTSPLLDPARACISSKIITRESDLMARIAVDAVCAVCDWERRDVHFDHIKIESRAGGHLEDSQLIKGLIIDKGISHPHMDKVVKDAKLAILTCPFECPKPKTKYELQIDTKEKFQRLEEEEHQYYRNMVKLCKDSGANLIICQWGFDDEANYLLMKNNLPAIRWVGGPDIELIAMATGGKIIPRFEDITADKLGHAGLVRELKLTTQESELTCIEGCPYTRAVTIFLRGGNKMIIEEGKRSIHDAICVVRNLIKDNRIVYGGGSSEIALSIYLNGIAETIATAEQYAVRAFCDALESIPAALADNSGLDAMDIIGKIKHLQIAEKNIRLGVDVHERGKELRERAGTTDSTSAAAKDTQDVEYMDMKRNKVFETLVGKKQQILLATQVVRMILKIDDIIQENPES